MESKGIKVRKALNQLRDEAASKNNMDVVFGIEDFLNSAEEDTLSRFYDIIMASATKSEALGNILGPTENVGSISHG
jgi:hypothetical protein